MKIKKALISALIVWHLFTLFIEGIPSTTVLHDLIGQQLSPYMNFVAQHQGSFAFFAPVPDKMNLHLEAEMVYTDGTRAAGGPRTGRTSPCPRNSCSAGS